jgi:hypothetical protein
MWIYVNACSWILIKYSPVGPERTYYYEITICNVTLSASETL